MTTKLEILDYVKQLSEQNIITKEELESAYNSGKKFPNNDSHSKNVDITEILYYIGGTIVFLGIAILIAQNWSTLSTFTKILATLGSGIAAYYTGILLDSKKTVKSIGNAFFLISSLTIPMGLFVLFDAVGMDIGDSGTISLITLILSIMYLASYLIFRKTIFVLFCTIFTTWLYFSLLASMTNGNYSMNTYQDYSYRVLFAGIGYILTGYFFSKNTLSSLSESLYGFGTIGVLGSIMALGGFQPNQDAFWELIYPVIIFGALFTSVYIKSKSVLTMGTIFLMIYILKITAEYFSTGLGWPLALVIAGLMMIGAGYMSITIKAKYMLAKK